MFGTLQHSDYSAEILIYSLCFELILLCLETLRLRCCDGLFFGMTLQAWYERLDQGRSEHKRSRIFWPDLVGFNTIGLS